MAAASRFVRAPSAARTSSRPSRPAPLQPGVDAFARSSAAVSGPRSIRTGDRPRVKQLDRKLVRGKRVIAAIESVAGSRSTSMPERDVTAALRYTAPGRELTRPIVDAAITPNR